MIHAGHLESRTTLFRNDLAVRRLGTSTNPHTFLTNILGAGADVRLRAQNQIATFFASDGATTIDPDGAAPYFETPSLDLPRRPRVHPLGGHRIIRRADGGAPDDA